MDAIVVEVNQGCGKRIKYSKHFLSMFEWCNTKET